MEFKDEVVDAIEYDYDFDDLVDELYNREDNYNNCDATSKQECYSKEEILIKIEECFEEIKKQDTNCSECGHYITNEENITEIQKHPYGDTYATEKIIIGYACKKCGNFE